MILDATRPELGSFGGSSAVVDEPVNTEARKFYDMLDAADTPIWERCSSHSNPRILCPRSVLTK
jgi:hypothetical protein